MQSLASQIIVGILTEEMGMPANSVWLRDQNRTIPNDNGLYISVGMTSAQVMAATSETKEINNTFTEINTVQQRESIQIDLFSNSNDALTRQWEVVAALKSVYAQQAQEASNFKIGYIPISFLDTSSAEGGSILKRYTITIAALVWYRKTKTINYYDDFSVRVDNENTIGKANGMIGFEIN